MLVFAVLSAALLTFAFAVSSSAANRDSLSKGEKLRIFVATRGTVPIPGSAVGGIPIRKAIAEEYFTVIAKAGFNVVCCSAKAPLDLERVSREALWAQKHGLFYLRWIRGKTGAGDGPKSLSNCIEPAMSDSELSAALTVVPRPIRLRSKSC